MWLFENHGKLVNKSSITLIKEKVSKLYAVHVLVSSYSECYRAQLFKKTFDNGVSMRKTLVKKSGSNTCQETLTAVELRTVTLKGRAELGTVNK